MRCQCMFRVSQFYRKRSRCVCVFEEGERLECVCRQWGMGVKGEIR